MTTAPHPGGLHTDIGGRMHQMAATALEFLYGRVSLLQWELAQERTRLMVLLRQTLLAALFILLSAQLLAVLLVAVAWNTPWRLHVIGALLAITVAGSIRLVLSLRAKGREEPQLFASTLHELAKDREALETLK